MSTISGKAPFYTMQDYGYPVQPVLCVGELVYCPAEDWRRISDGMGFYPVHCPAMNCRHTGWPDPVTRRRMRHAFYHRSRE